MKFAPTVLAFCLCCAPIYNARAQNATEQTALPRAGEIALEGRVAALGDGQFTLEVIAFTNPNGNRAVLPAPKNKTVFTNAAPDLKIGETVAVIGINNPLSLKARTILRPSQKIIGAPPGAKTRAETAKPILAAPYPPAFKADDLTITPVQAGFDYSSNVFPGFQTFERTPVFNLTFAIQSGDAKAKIAGLAQRVVLRRIIGPQNQFVAPFSLDTRARPVKGTPDRAGFALAGVDPNWDRVDLDLDVISPQTTEAASGGVIELKDIQLPAMGTELAIDREFRGALGTRFRVVKVRRDDKGWTYVTVHHEKPDAPADLEITGYNLSFSSAQASSGGGGGLTNGLAGSGDNELMLSTDKTLDLLSNLKIEMREKAPSLIDRSRVTRQRLRYDLQKLRANEKMAPIEIENAPSELGRTQNDEVAVRAETDGLGDNGNRVGLLMAAQSAPANEQRGLRWKIASARASFDNGAPDAEVQNSSSAMTYLWHSDGTPLSPGETIEKRSLVVPKGAASYDLKLEMEGRVTIEEWFAREIKIPLGQAVITPPDDGEQGLILRKIQRFSAPDELANYPQWIRGQWPNAGLALVFEANPQLLNPEIFANAYDAEDDQGRELKTGTLIEKSLYNIDMTDANSKFRQSKFYTLIVGQPAPDAKKLKMWLHLSEQASDVEKTTLEMENLAVSQSDK